jgi:hypothetical protein
MKATNDPILGAVSMPAPSALGGNPFPAGHVVFGAGPQALFIHTLREAPLAGFSTEELGWALAPKAAIGVKLAGAKDLDWHLDPTELEP